MPPRLTEADLDRIALDAEHAGRIPAGDTAVARFMASDSYRAAAEHKISSFSVTVLSAAEVRQVIRADAGDFPGREHRSVTVRPTPHGYHALIDVEDVTDGTIIQKVSEATRTIGGDQVDLGISLGGSRVTFSEATPTPLLPFGTYYDFDESLMEQPDVVRTIVRPLVTAGWWQALDIDLIAGDGSTISPGHHRLDGVLADDDVEELDLAISTDVLATASGMVGAAGHDGPQAVIASPTTIATEIFGDDTKDVRGALPLIERYVPNLAVPDGLAIVARPSAGQRLFIGAAGLTIEGDLNIVTSVWTLKARAYVHSWVMQPDAFVIVGQPLES